MPARHRLRHAHPARRTPLLLAAICLTLAPLLSAPRASAADDAAPSKVLPVDSSAFVFSPGNWVGDAGRAGKVYRQTWYPGAYVRITWTSAASKVAPVLTLDTSMFAGHNSPPVLACNLDGVWSGDVPCAPEITLDGMTGPGKHTLTVYVKKEEQKNRWGTPGQSGANVTRITGLKVDADAQPADVATKPRPWALIVGDSITEGIGANELEGYSHLVGQGLGALGYEYCISACGWSGWIHRGDNPPGDVPAYYNITDSADGVGGTYHPDDSRWHMVDANHSLLDSRGHLSGYGDVGQEPAIILINYGTNDAIHKGMIPSDVQASITQCLPVLRHAAPNAHLFILIPFGQYKAAELKQAVAAYNAAHPDDHGVHLIDLGPEAARALTVKNGYWGGLHPNPRAHATFGAQITAQIVATIKPQ
ncbi:MAG: hypothetical protein GC159_17355 [Phycisphaera sp.]|nr:hypothetical protein [Phycisphaera sp.]